MVSFDALRASHIGAMSYYCKPQPPEELIGCWKLSTDYSDFSRYGNSISGPFANIYESQYMSGPFKRCFGYSEAESVGYSPLSLPLIKAINLGSPWSFDFYSFVGVLNGLRVIIGNFNISWENGWGQAAGYPKGVNFNGSNLSRFHFTQSSFRHTALTYTGNSVRVYVDGALSENITTTLDGTANSVLINADNSSREGGHISNLRIVQKCIGTASYYPVPSGLYTGLEPL